MRRGASAGVEFGRVHQGVLGNRIEPMFGEHRPGRRSSSDRGRDQLPPIVAGHTTEHLDQTGRIDDDELDGWFENEMPNDAVRPLFEAADFAQVKDANPR